MPHSDTHYFSLFVLLLRFDVLLPHIDVVRIFEETFIELLNRVIGYEINKP